MIDLQPTQFNNLNKTPAKVFLEMYVPLLEGAPTMFYSPGGVGKSFAAMRCGIEFFIETGGKVALWLTEDSEAENRARFHSLVDHCYPDKADKIFKGVVLLNVAPVKFTRMAGGNAELTQDFWEVRMALLDYDMVVIDPLLQFQGCDENSNTHAAVWMGAAKQWAAEEMKVLLILHHATFDQNGRLKARGAGEWTYGARAAYSLQQIKDDAGNLVPEFQSSLLFDLTKHNGLGRYFMNPNTGELTHTIEVFPPHVIPKNDKPQNSPLFLSIAPHNNLQQPGGFEWQEVQFAHLHTMLANNKAYSPYNFKDGYRCGKNNLGDPSLLILDIDDGMTLDDAKKTFESVQSLIITTKSHQQAKKDKPACDRFRVIVAMDSPMTFPLDDYADFLTQVSTSIGGVVDASTTDLARFYLASPEDAIYHYSGSTKRWNWEIAYREMRKHIRAKETIQKHLMNFENNDAKPTNYKSSKPNGKQSNTLPADTVFQTRQGEVTFNQLKQTLSAEAKSPVKCLAGIDHGGAGPDHYSAFIKKAENGNVFYSCSGGRCADVGSLWCEDIDPDEPTSKRTGAVEEITT